MANSDDVVTNEPDTETDGENGAGVAEMTVGSRLPDPYNNSISIARPCASRWSDD